MSDPLVIGSALAFVFISFYFYFCTNACQEGQNTRAQVVTSLRNNSEADIESEQIPSQTVPEMFEMTPTEDLQVVVVSANLDPPPPFEDDPPAYETLFPESVNQYESQV